MLLLFTLFINISFDEKRTASLAELNTIYKLLGKAYFLGPSYRPM